MDEKNITIAEPKPIRKRNRKPNSYAVTDQELLYKLADAGLLDKLHGVRYDNEDRNKRVYFFDRCLEVRELVEQTQ